MAHFEAIYSAEVTLDSPPNNWRICLQWGTYVYDDGTTDKGYRYINIMPNGNLQPARGQARIPSAAVMLELQLKAIKAGWFIRCEEDD